MLEKTYDAATVEPRIYAAWEEAGAFRAGASAEPGAPPYCIVIPPPNVTGSLHMGHALNNTLQDILVRFERMRGRDVLWQPGTDHAGIATQMVVERQMMERQEPNRRAIGRDKFVEKIWAWKAESGGAIVNQLKRLGASCDWSRERFTMDEGLSHAVTKVFVDLYRQRLIYKDKRLVNWDPQLQTAISDLEVQQVETKGHLWHLRYPIEGRKFDPEDVTSFIVVATTRPETMLGDTGVAVNPEDDRYRDLVGKNVVLPLVGRRIPIVADEYADPEAGSGAVKITPAHDFNDFEVGKRHDLPRVNVLDVEGNVVLKGNADFLAGVPQSAELSETIGLLDRLDRFAVRKRVVEMLEIRGLVEKIEPHLHSVPHGDRSNVPIEPFLTDQWYVDAATLAKPALASVREGRTVFVPRTWEKTYFDWMENIQPWCISRQLWWGHRIPAWYGPSLQKPLGHPHLYERKVFVAATEEEAKVAAEEYYGTEINFVPDSSDFQAAVETFVLANPGDGPVYIGPVPLCRDEDVLDTWFSSALWPFSTLGWPEGTPELKRYYPNAVLVTGFDIIFFWVARMMMMGLHFTGKEPFPAVYIHGIVRDEKGAKMSKSKGNVVDPLELIDEFGADAVRFTMAALATPGRDVKPARSRIEGYRNFATKLWNAARFCEINECRPVAGFDPARVSDTLNRWIATEASRTARAVNDALGAYRFDEAASVLYRFVWNAFCDWYLELAKPVLSGSDGAVKDETRATAAWTLQSILGMLHPFMPFVTEELWQRTQPANGKMLAVSHWPSLQFEDEAAAAEINWVVGLVSEIRSVRSEMNVPAGAQVPIVVSGASDVSMSRLKAHDTVIRRLARAQSIEIEPSALAGAVQLVVGEATVSLPIADIVDLKAERQRLIKELEKVGQEIAKVDAKLGNQQFMAKAPEEIVEEQRERRAEADALRVKLRAALDRLSL